MDVTKVIIMDCNGVLMSFSTIFQSYYGSQCTYLCLTAIIFTSTSHNSISRTLPAVRYNDHWYIDGWLVVLGFNPTVTAMVISWRSVTHMCFLAFLHQYWHNFLSKATTTFLTCFSRGERRKYAGKKFTPQLEWMNEWCFKAWRQLRSYWAHLHID